MTCECGKVTDEDECVPDCEAAICHNCKASIVPGRYWYVAAGVTKPLCGDCWHTLMEERGGE